ncbi:MAG: hypothetical protein AAGD32_03620 [Planctomycetota bacterium]
MATFLPAATAAACDICSWGSAHADGTPFPVEDRIAAYNANLAPGQRPIDLNNYGPNAAIAEIGPGGTTQQVFVDFSGAIPGVYSPAEQASVITGLSNLFAGFDINFSLTDPAGADTDLVFDAFGLGGIAVTGIDFRNISASDLAFIGTDGLLGFSSAEQVNYAINVGGHELGHTLGLRHHDAFGPIGSGVPSTGLETGFVPSFPGGTAANEFFGNTMSTPAFGGDFGVFFSGFTNFSDRSAIKLQFAAVDDIIPEAAGFNNTLATAQPIELQLLDLSGIQPIGEEFFGEDVPVRANAVTGTLSSAADLDVFEIQLFAGNLLSVEIVSESVAERFTDLIDAEVTVLDEDGNPLDYFGTSAFNDDEIETLDSFIFDLLIPEDGTYFVEVDATSLNPTGSYEVFFASVGFIPEPGSLALAGVAGLALLRRRVG